MSTQLFLAGEERFANAHALVPDRGTQNPGELKAKAVSPNLNLYQVKGENRILFARVVADPGALNLYNVEFSNVWADQDWFPVYWLPWYGQQTYRITLKPSSKLSIAYDDRVANPQHFFTAALSGCMVHVEGDADAPTVYHGNAIAFQPTAQPPAQPEMRQMWLAGQKVQDMEQRFQDFSQLHPKRAAQKRLTTKSIDAFTYQFETATGLGQDELQWRERHRVNAIGSDELNIQQRGTVFGVKDHNGWRFYLQALIRTVRYNTSNPHSVRLESWAVAKCKQFWP